MKFLSTLAVAVLVLLVNVSSPAFARGGGGYGGHSRSGYYSGYGYTNPSSHSVRGYYRKDGTYIPPHRATNPDNTGRDNYSTKGNANRNTGKPGDRYVDK